MAKPVPATITGTRGSDIITDPPNNSSIDTGYGNDTVLIGLFTETGIGITANGGNGNDQIFDYSVGGIFITDPRSTLLGGGGNDLIVTGTYSDTIDGGPGADQIYAGVGNHVTLDGQDTFHVVASYNGLNILNFPYLNSGLITDIHGATASTKFDFSSVNPPGVYYDFEHVAPVSIDPNGFAQEPFKLNRSNFSFDGSGNLVIRAEATNGEGTYVNTLTGTPWHTDSAFDAAIAKGTVII